MAEYIERKARYIDANAIKYRTHTECGGHGIFYDVTTVSKDEIDKIPTADVVEVRHGEWKEYFMYDCWHYDCPFCDDGYATKGREKHPANYCSNCGAKLDGKGEGE